MYGAHLVKISRECYSYAPLEKNRRIKACIGLDIIDVNGKVAVVCNSSVGFLLKGKVYLQ